jgi:hypothetical protein
MIGKVIRGSYLPGLIRYLFGPGEFNVHQDPRVVAGFRPPAELDPGYQPDGRRHLRPLDELLTQPLGLLEEIPPRSVWHYPIRAHPDDPILTDQQWNDIATEIMHATGLATRGDEQAVRWIAVRHADDHIHIVAVLARQDGQRPDIHNDAYKARDALREIEKRYGLVRTAPADRTAPTRPTRGESERAFRNRRTEEPRVTLRRLVTTCAAEASSETEFFERLEREGVRIRKRFSIREPDQATGYAVGLSDDLNVAGEPIFYSGGKLASDLTLPQLRSRWQSDPSDTDPRTKDFHPLDGRRLSDRSAVAYLRSTVRTAADRARTEVEFFELITEAGVLVRKRFSTRTPDQITGYAVTLPGCFGHDGRELWYSGGRLSDVLTLPSLRQRWDLGHAGSPHHRGGAAFTAEERQAFYDDAADAAAYATEQICEHGPGSREAADAAWAAAGTLHVAAQTLGNPHLRRAADAYDRAARQPYGRIPAPTPAGNGLRTTARLMSMAKAINSPATLNILILVANLMALTEAVAELRSAEERRAQAMAARVARDHLQEGLLSSGDCVDGPHPGQRQRPGNARSR